MKIDISNGIRQAMPDIIDQLFCLVAFTGNVPRIVEKQADPKEILITAAVNFINAFQQQQHFFNRAC